MNPRLPPTDRLLRERRSLTEVLGKYLTPRESFHMRLKQLSLEYPHWDSSGREDGEAARDDQGREYIIYIEMCGIRHLWRQVHSIAEVLVSELALSHKIDNIVEILLQSTVSALFVAVLV